MLLFIAAVLVLFLVSMSTYEHMTNKDLMSALKKYGTEDKKKPAKEETPAQAPIYGPKVPPVEHPSPTKPSSKSSNADSSTYPDIYGPDVAMEPGKVCKEGGGKHSSDDVSDCTYQYNPDLQKAFPTSGPPQPFLADFSKFQS